LKWKDLIEWRIHYKRAKTGKETSFKVNPKAVHFLSDIRPITGGNAENYIFPILFRDRHKTPTQIDNRIHKIITRVNKHLKEIGADIGLEIPLTTYVARHTMATVLKRANVPTSVISEAMMHKSESVTQVYLKSFENDIIDNAAGENL
jgi:integrase